MLSRRADYGVRAMVDIALQHPTTRTVVSEIAKRQDIPASFLAKIIPMLARAGLVRTTLGARGGITLAVPPEEISLMQIIEAIDGPLALNLCSLNPSDCPRYAHCASCRVWGKAQAQLNQTLTQARLSDLARHKGIASSAESRKEGLSAAQKSKSNPVR